MDINQTEKLIIEKCLQHDPVGQKQLYDKYCDAMYTIAYRILNNVNDAQDALQDAFIKVFTNLNTFRYESTLGAWIKKILVREAIKRSKGQFQFEKIEESHFEVIEWQDGLTGEYLHKAIMELPDGYRKIFVLVEVEGYKHKEVADMLNINIGTSKSQLYYAKKLLRQKLEELKK